MQWRPAARTKRRADWLALLLGQETAKAVETDPYCDARAQFQGRTIVKVRCGPYISTRSFMLRKASCITLLVDLYYFFFFFYVGY